ncbi:hypothetical protein G9A89_014347 [Geosiphon pyriformis]|nr:hypothetical protein G9A89_014347 [Geosiphon pyriformis]
MTTDTSNVPKLKGLDHHVLLGSTGLRVSPLCLGTGTFGEEWGIGSNFEESKKVFDYYYEKGGNFIDTGNIYNQGSSEKFLGELISDKRSEIILATKYTCNPSAGGLLNGQLKYNPNAGGNHRKSLVENLDASLKRLGTGYVDILYVHAWEFRSSIQETMRALDDAVRSGKVYYVAISDAPAWVVSKSNTIAEFRGWSPYIALQTRYNLLDRSFEQELQPASADQNLAVIPWGCIAEGFLTGKYTKESLASKKGEQGGRNGSNIKHGNIAHNWEILETVKEIAAETGKSPAQVSINWISQKPSITSPLIGARNVKQLEENIQSLDFKLTSEQMKRLDDISAPQNLAFPYGHGQLFEMLIGPKIEVPKKFEPIFHIKKFGE